MLFSSIKTVKGSSMINTLPIQISSYNNVQKVNHAPVFTGLKPAEKMVRQTDNFAKKMYQTLFLGGKSDVCKIEDGFVYTQDNINNRVISKKFKLLHRKPETVIKDNNFTSLRERVDFNKNGTTNVEIQDIYTKGYKVSASYSGVKDGQAGESVKINYGDKQFEISKETREALCGDFNKVLNEKFSKTSEEMRKMSDSEFDSYMNGYRLTPETTAAAILTSPQALKDQLSCVNRALPYGIECIMSKLGM